jgi:hypothetical protein
MPTKIRQIEVSKTPESPGGFSWRIALFCVAVALVITISVLATVVSPTMWQETGVIP